MKKQLMIVGLLSLIGAHAGAQQQSMTSVEWARVKSSEPIYGQAAAVQRPVCTTQMVQRTVTPAPDYYAPSQGTSNIGGAIVGTLLGGALGSQVGGGRGKTAAIALGAGAGALMGQQYIGGNGNSSSHQTPSYGQTQTVPVENCVMTTEMQPAPVVGYRIVLDHNGKDFVYQSPVAPRDDYVKIRVQITPEF